MEKENRIEIRLAGSGGQGLVLAGLILAYAAIIDGKNAVQTQMHGPESRGGMSRSEVIISDKSIAYPQCTIPDILLVMSQEAYDKFAGQVKPGGRFYVDSTFITGNMKTDGINSYYIPVTEETKKQLDKAIVANITAISLVNEVEELVNPDALFDAIKQRVPEKFRDLNESAFHLGRELAREYIIQKSKT